MYNIIISREGEGKEKCFHEIFPLCLAQFIISRLTINKYSTVWLFPSVQAHKFYSHESQVLFLQKMRLASRVRTTKGRTWAMALLLQRREWATWKMNVDSGQFDLSSSNGCWNVSRSRSKKTNINFISGRILCANLLYSPPAAFRRLTHSIAPDSHAKLSCNQRNRETSFQTRKPGRLSLKFISTLDSSRVWLFELSHFANAELDLHRWKKKEGKMQCSAARYRSQTQWNLI